MTSASEFFRDRERPAFPKRAVVTAGMPYGNKDLHFGHIGGVFIFADVYARFLRDRLGEDNVLFVSGTDCYGSPIVADHVRKVEDGEFSGTLEEFAGSNHQRQTETLNAYSIGLSAFAASAMEPYQPIHADLGAMIMRQLFENGHLKKRTTLQFYDTERETYLNGRQVLGRCPIQGCKSEKAYADECSLGHQYEPKELVAPRSALTDNTPEMRDVTNWYLPLEGFRPAMQPWLTEQLESGAWREFSVQSALEYFEEPTIHVKQDLMEEVEKLVDQLPTHRREEGNAKSERLIFESLEVMDQAKAILTEAGIRYRTGKALVPFRLTGNLEWGLPAPELEETKDLTFWVWPESLWAPISFVATILQQRGEPIENWRDWWCSKDAMAYQFIGEDNLFYYGVAEMAMFLGMQGEDYSADAPEGQIQLPTIVANRHLLFLDKKASSSGKIKPPMATELLDHYTSDQLRIHFLSLNLGNRNLSFRPKPLDPRATEGGGDPVLKDGNVLSNSLNHSVRSCFYTTQKYLDGKLPVGIPSEDLRRESEAAILDFEAAMARREFHTAVGIGGDYIRSINSRWSQSQPYKDECPDDARVQALVDAFHGVRVAIAMMHPVAPDGTERVREFLRVGPELWSWDRIFEPLSAFVEDPNDHQLEFLPPRVDFFEKHESQFKKK